MASTTTNTDIHQTSTMTTRHQFFDGAGKHSLGIAIAVAALVLVGIGVGVTVNRRAEKTIVGKNALFLAGQSFEAEMKALSGVQTLAPPAQTATKEEQEKYSAKQAQMMKSLEDASFQKMDVDAKLPETVKKLQGVAEQYSGTRPAFDARLRLGDLYFNHGETAKAVSHYEAAASAAPNGFEKALALSSLGYAQENLGKFAEAVTAFEKALNLGEAGIKGDLLLAIARCHEALHDSAKARSTYDQIISQLPGTEAAKTAELLKSRI